MTEEFLVDVYLNRKSGLLNLKNHRISFKDKHMEIYRNSDEDPTKIYCSQLQYKPLKRIPKKDVLAIVPSAEENNIRSIKLVFTPPHDQFLDWVVENYNKMIEANKDEMTKPQTKNKMPPVLSSNNNSGKQAPRINSLFKEKECLKELARQNSLTDSSQSSSVSVPKTQHSETEKPPQTGLNMTNEMISRSDPFNISLKKENKKPSIPSFEQSDYYDEFPALSCSDKEPKREVSISEESPPSVKQESLSISPIQSKETVSREESVSKEIKDEDYWTMSPTKSSLSYKKLENTGNSCYLNSTMQALSACYPFSSRCIQLNRAMNDDTSLFSDERRDEVLKKKYKVFDALTVVIPRLLANNDKQTAIERSKLLQFRQDLGELNRDFANDSQQDAHEYLITLLEAVDDIFLANKKSTSDSQKVKRAVSFLNPADVFKFTVESMFVCQSCNKMESKSEMHNDLRLSVKDGHTIQEMAASFGEWTPVEKNCSYCKANVSSFSERISEFPRALVVYLKQYELSGDSYVKTNRTVEPTFEMDVSSLGVFTETVHSELKPPEISKITSSPSKPSLSKDENGDISDVDNKQIINNNRPKSVDNQDSQSDVIVEKVSRPKELHFKLLSDPKTVEVILRRLKITWDKKTLSAHLRSMEQQEEVLSILHTDPPRHTITIAADGNCFFRAVSWCLTGVQTHHTKLRERTVKYLKENEASMKKYCPLNEYGKHVDGMSKDGEWATSCEIFAMANLLNVKILTFLSNGRWVCHNPTDNSPADGSIFLKNVSFHFEPTTSLKSAKKSTETLPKVELGNGLNNQKKGTGGEDGANDFPDENSKNESNQSASRLSLETQNVKEPTKPVFYDLAAVICHIGESPNRGHYVAFTKDLYNDKWYRCSDDYIYEVQNTEIVTAVRQSGYIFFYDRRPSYDIEE